MRRVVAAAVLVLIPALVWGQPELHSGAKGAKPAANPTATSVDANTNALDVNVVQSVAPGASTCTTVTVNAQGVAGAAITVDATAGGISVMAADATRCAALITNIGAADMNCSPTTQTPTSTVGQRVFANSALVLGTEGRQAWKCIRVTGTNTTATVSEAAP